MIVSLRTRLFLTVAIVVATAIAASGLLSRRATLVEVREMVKQSAVPEARLFPFKARVEQGLARGADPNEILAEVARESDRGLILVGPDQQVVGGSRPDLVTARVRQAGEDGTLDLQLQAGGGQTAIVLRGAPPIRIDGADGRPRGMLYLVPADGAGAPLPAPRILSPLVVTNGAVVAVALILTFMLSRRILRPVGELKAAAERMERGDLDVQVAVRGADELGELGRTFNSMAARLAETERLRRQMVSDVAHELRSPVTNLRCTLEAIQDGLAQPDRANLDALLEETLFLQRLITDLQELALADAGRLQLHMAEVNVEAVVRRAAAAMSASPGAPLALEIADDLPPVRGDADRLEQVLRNLLTNARRHTPAGGRIIVAASRCGAGVRIVVADTGSGIAAEHLPHVFDRFYRADQSRARATGGAGLGLAIVRQLVTAHGGTVTAASGGAGQGATFTIDMPAVEPA